MTSVLIADDDAGFRVPLQNLFEDFGYDVRAVADKQGVLEMAPRSDVWIVDVRLPTSAYEGIAAIQELADRQVISRYPVVFISVQPEELCRESLQSLADRGISFQWIEKPFELEHLLRITESLLKG